MTDRTFASKDEREIVRRAAAGDSHAFSQIYRTHLDRIYRYVYFRVGSVQEAEDLTETVFLSAWKAIGRYQERGTAFQAWLYRIASNLIIDHHRARKETEHLEVVEEIPAEGGAGPEAWVANAEDTEALRKGIQCLPEEGQQVLLLRFVEGLSHAQVAEVLGKSEGACRAIQHRALAALRENLNGRI